MGVKTRRHHNNTGKNMIKNGTTHRQVKEMEKRLLKSDGFGTIIEEVLAYNNGLCMDVPSERKRLSKAILKALRKYRATLTCMRYAADVLKCQPDARLILPDDIAVHVGKIKYFPVTDKNYHSYSTREIGGLVRYLADMME